MTLHMVVLGAVITALLSGVVTWYFSARRRVSVDSDVYDILTVQPKLKNRLRIFFDEEPIEDLHLWAADVTNDGNRPIRASDHDEPPVILMPTGSRAVWADADIGGSREVLKTGGTQIALPKKLLNQRARMKIRVLYTGAKGTPSLHLGVPGLGVTSVRSGPMRAFVWLVIGFVLSYVITAAEMLDYPLPSAWKLFLGFVALYFALGGVVEIIRRERRLRKHLELREP